MTHLSYLDFDHPSQVAITCISNLFKERVCDLGLSEEEAMRCMEAAKANFRSEAIAKLYFSSSHGDEKKIRLRHWADDPIGLSGAFDQIVRDSSRMTISKFGDGLPAESKEDLELIAEFLVVSRSFFYCGSTSQIFVKSLKIRNGQVTLLKMFHHNSDIRPPSQPSSAPDESPLTLTIHDRVVVNRGYCQDIFFETGSVESTFSPEDALDAAKTCGILFDIMLSDKNDYHPKMPVNDVTVNGSLSSLTFVLTDKLLPFIECRLQDVVFEKSARGSQTTKQTIVHAGTISLDCVIESSYPNIISTHTSNGEDFDERSAFSFQLTTQLIPSAGPTEFTFALNGLRITVLRKIINETLQYISSPTYGIGLFLNRFREDKELSSDGFLAPPKLKVSIHNCSIILPRDSNSIDLVGLEVDEISISREQVAETWSVNEYSFSNDELSQRPGREKIVASISSSDVFFDCVDEKAPLTQIPRFAINVKGAHVFTALHPCHFSSREIDMPSFNANVTNTGLSLHNKRPFTVVGEVSEVVAEDLTLRVWEKVNEGPLNLSITVDHVPYLRLLAEDVSDDNNQGVHCSMRMSQFYLVMSIWFSNMQQLPLLFPYEIEFVEKSSIDPYPPSNWPEYGTNEFVKRLKQCGSVAKRKFEMTLCFKNVTWQCMTTQLIFPLFHQACPRCNHREVKQKGCMARTSFL